MVSFGLISFAFPKDLPSISDTKAFQIELDVFCMSNLSFSCLKGKLAWLVSAIVVNNPHGSGGPVGWVKTISPFSLKQPSK